MSRHPRIIWATLKPNADVNMLDGQGATALHLARSGRHEATKHQTFEGVEEIGNREPGDLDTRGIPNSAMRSSDNRAHGGRGNSIRAIQHSPSGQVSTLVQTDGGVGFWLREYEQEMGMSCTDANQLRCFAAARGGKLTFMQSRHTIRSRKPVVWGGHEATSSAAMAGVVEPLVLIDDEGLYTGDDVFHEYKTIDGALPYVSNPLLRMPRWDAGCASITLERDTWWISDGHGIRCFYAEVDETGVPPIKTWKLVGTDMLAKVTLCEWE